MLVLEIADNEVVIVVVRVARIAVKRQSSGSGKQRKIRKSSNSNNNVRRKRNIRMLGFLVLAKNIVVGRALVTTRKSAGH